MWEHRSIVSHMLGARQAGGTVAMCAQMCARHRHLTALGLSARPATVVDHQGRIEHARRLLVESAWHARRRPTVGY